MHSYLYPLTFVYPLIIQSEHSTHIHSSSSSNQIACSLCTQNPANHSSVFTQPVVATHSLTNQRVFYIPSWLLTNQITPFYVARRSHMLGVNPVYAGRGPRHAARAPDALCWTPRCYVRDAKRRRLNIPDNNFWISLPRDPPLLAPNIQEIKIFLQFPEVQNKYILTSISYTPCPYL